MTEPTQLDRIEAILGGVITRLDRVEQIQTNQSVTLEKLEHTQIHQSGTLESQSGTLEKHSRRLRKHSRTLGKHSRTLDEHTRRMDEGFEKMHRHMDMLAESFRSDFRAVMEEIRGHSTQLSELHSWREETDIRLNILTTGHRGLDRRLISLKKPRRR